MKEFVRRKDGIVQRYNFKGGSPYKIFNINDDYYIQAQSQNTRNGFRHVAVLYASAGRIPLDEAKATYLNRTWESYEFETVVKKLLTQTDALTQEEKNAFLNNSKRFD